MAPASFVGDPQPLEQLAQARQADQMLLLLQPRNDLAQPSEPPATAL